MLLVSRWFQELRLARKLIAIGVATTALTVLAACITIVAFDLSSSRARLAREVELLGDVVASNLTAAVAFGDPTAAREILSSVSANKHIISATVRLTDGSTFAAYARGGRPAAF